MSKTINVDIDNETGDLSVDIIGGTDSSCKAVADAFKKLGKVTKDIHKPEYYKAPNQNKVQTGR
jgi:hypothetical protein